MDVAYSVQQTRDSEEVVIERGGGDALMQRAAHGLATVVTGELVRRRGRTYGARVVILVGPGNNGGDALFAGARLASRGARVLAVRALGEPHPAGLAALLAAGGQVLDQPELAASGDPADWWQDLAADLVIDGILGIGGRPGLPAAVAGLVRLLETQPTPVIAVDLPSGVSADTGAVPGISVRATRTVTFASRKPCHLIEPARSRCGLVDVIDIGLETAEAVPALVAWTAESEVAAGWPWPGPSSDKYARGVVGIDTGSEQYPGAGILSTYGAVLAGAGMVRFVGTEVAARVIGEQLPNVVFSAGRVQAWLLGSGWGERPDGARVVAEAVHSGVPVVIDADGLRHLPSELPASCLLTPHAGELARLLDSSRAEVESDPIAAVRAAAARTGATVLLKGATQLVATPGLTEVSVALPGPAWTGQAGSGDVLGGVCATLLAAGVGARQAGVLGASLQALAASQAPGPWPPQELAQRFPAVLGRMWVAMGAAGR